MKSKTNILTNVKVEVINFFKTKVEMWLIALMGTSYLGVEALVTLLHGDKQAADVNLEMECLQKAGSDLMDLTLFLIFLFIISKIESTSKR